MKRYFTLFILLSAVFVSCKKSDKLPPIDNNIDLDGTLINDSSLSYPERFLQSVRNKTPNELEKNQPVFICVHGYSASTFEWIEFRDFIQEKGSATTSLVLLGGHGRDYEDFKKATWTDWQIPILTEIQNLTNLGYKNLYLIGSSTGCPLILNAFYQNKLTSNVKGITLIDPIIVPSNKTLSLVSAVGPMLNYSTSEFEVGEVGFWYKYRPYQSLKELNTLTQEVRKKLEDGIQTNIPITVYKSNKDGSADPIGAVLLDKGLKPEAANLKKIKIIDSDLHVFTRLKGRNTFSTKDKENQQIVFNEIVNYNK
jgi:carboxylesterase